MARPFGGNFVTYVFNNGCVIGRGELLYTLPLVFGISMFSFYFERIIKILEIKTFFIAKILSVMR
jgi:hypothetical protein